MRPNHGCPCTYSPHADIALHEGHCCYLPLDDRGHARPSHEMPVWPEPLPCGHDDSSAIADDLALFEVTA